MKLEESINQTSDYTTNLQSSRQYGTVQKQKYRPMEQENTEINPHSYLGTLFLAKEARIYNGGKDSFFNKWCFENCTATCKRMNLDHYLMPYTKMKLKWTKDLNGRPETIILLEGNIGRTLDDINQSKIFYDPPPRVMEIKTKVYKWDLIKLRSFWTTKETTNKVERQPSE